MMPDRPPPIPHRAGATPNPLPATMPSPAILPAVLAADPAASGGPNMFVILLGTLAIFWFVAILPERKARKKKQSMIDALQKNDKVLTTSGMYATVAAMGESDLTLKFDDGNTRVRVLRSAIASVLDKDGEAEG